MKIKLGDTLYESTIPSRSQVKMLEANSVPGSTYSIGDEVWLDDPIYPGNKMHGKIMFIDTYNGKTRYQCRLYDKNTNMPLGSSEWGFEDTMSPYNPTYDDGPTKWGPDATDDDFRNPKWDYKEFVNKAVKRGLTKNQIKELLKTKAIKNILKD